MIQKLKLGKQKRDFGMLYEFILIVAIIAIVSVLVFQVNEDARKDIIESDRIPAIVVNETNAFINATGYTVAEADAPHFTSPTITAIWSVQGGLYNVSVLTTDAIISSTGVVKNATATTYPNVSISYTYSYTPLSYAYNGTVDSDSAVGKIPQSLSLLAIAIVFGVILWVIFKVVPIKTGSSTTSQ